ncbi:hypothetical protein EAS64_23720 [Trebonia kvetii]|uniref:Uncharacterized protein n=1 Tax=Trebonia kvetii TaxID=2480626 RepID=A0A6P2BWA1_9ACTN|nr:hypothetical protein [Trebonia kvetii]TVZ03409.1 hypothetical protein EAS64_23720 [Trebonia kvetii]
MTQPLGNCPGCGGDEPFEQVHPGRHAGDRCPDVDGECPEWVCLGCGAAVVMGTVFMGTGVPTGSEALTSDDAFADTPIPIRPMQSVRAA